MKTTIKFLIAFALGFSVMTSTAIASSGESATGETSNGPCSNNNMEVPNKGPQHPTDGSGSTSSDSTVRQ